MSKYKVAVYAICKNEEKFVERWVKSVSEADDIYVLDTGSSDNSVSLLREMGVHVKEEKIEPWRFDVARNKSLEMVDYDIDICVCIDLDEVLEAGWRDRLENNWQDDTTRARYNYNWKLDENNNSLVNFYYDKIHTRWNYKWTHPVHEVLIYTGSGNEQFVTIDDITVNHYPDSNKSRSNYLPLLELSVKEDPQDDRNMHYLGREYMFYGRWNECIDTLIKHLKLKNATWRDERCASMRFIARSYVALGRYDEARMWLDKAMKEAPYLRDSFVERALLEYQDANWLEVDKYCDMALRISSHPKSYINEEFSFDYTIYDLLSISKFNQKEFGLALDYSNRAIEMSLNQKRLIDNNRIIKEFISNTLKNDINF